MTLLDPRIAAALDVDHVVGCLCSTCRVRRRTPCHMFHVKQSTSCAVRRELGVALHAGEDTPLRQEPTKGEAEHVERVEKWGWKS